MKVMSEDTFTINERAGEGKSIEDALAFELH